MRPSPRHRGATVAVLVLLLGVLGSLAGARPAAAAQAGWADFSAIGRRATR